MNQTISNEQKYDFLKRGFIRRNLGKAASLLAAGATLPFYNEPALAQLSMIGRLSPDAVKINANENPLGPCPEAAEAIYSVVKKGRPISLRRNIRLCKNPSRRRRRQSQLRSALPRFQRPPAPRSSRLHRTRQTIGYGRPRLRSRIPRRKIHRCSCNPGPAEKRLLA